MKLTKERAKKPLIEDDGGFIARQGARDTFTLECHGPWQEKKGYSSSYTMHLSKADMLWVVKTWLAGLQEDERRAERARAAITTSQRAEK